MNRNTKLLSLLMLMAVIAASVLPAMGQAKRKPRIRRTPRAKVVRPVTPPIVYYTVASGQVINVRMNKDHHFGDGEGRGPIYDNGNVADLRQRDRSDTRGERNHRSC